MLFKIIAVVLFAVVCRHLLVLVDILGFFRTVHTHWPGPCRNVGPINTGSEQIVVTSDGLAFITSGLLTEYRGDTVDPRMKSFFEGKIFLFNFSDPEKDAKALEIDVKFDFMPHGMGLYEDQENGEIRLFVVNHREGEDTVEIITYQRKTSTLRHVKTIRDPLFTSLNDVTPTGPNAFYATNDGYFRNSTLRVPELFLFLPWGSIVYFDGKMTRKVVDSVYEPNGISMSSDGTTVVVCMAFQQSIHIYHRQGDNSLILSRELKVQMSCDNVFIHPKTGHLWLGVLAKPHTVIESIGNIEKTSPAMACRLEPRGPPTDVFQSFQIYEVFADNTGLISTSSSVVEYGDKLLIGSISHKLVFCEMETKY